MRDAHAFGSTHRHAATARALDRSPCGRCLWASYIALRGRLVFRSGRPKMKPAAASSYGNGRASPTDLLALCQHDTDTLLAPAMGFESPAFSNQGQFTRIHACISIQNPSSIGNQTGQSSDPQESKRGGPPGARPTAAATAAAAASSITPANPCCLLLLGLGGGACRSESGAEARPRGLG